VNCAAAGPETPVVIKTSHKGATVTAHLFLRIRAVVSHGSKAWLRSRKRTMPEQRRPPLNLPDRLFWTDLSSGPAGIYSGVGDETGGRFLAATSPEHSCVRARR